MTAEKTLEFAYKMRKSLESRFTENEGVLPDDPEKLSKVREILIPELYPEYRDILDMISECEAEIAYNAAKSAGKPNEKKRTAAAKKLLKKSPRDSLKGYKPTENGIVICNGFIAFMGDSIIGIPEISDSDYLDRAKTFFTLPTEPAKLVLSPKSIISALKTAKAEFKDCKKSEELCKLSPLALTMVCDRAGNRAYMCIFKEEVK